MCGSTTKSSASCFEPCRRRWLAMARRRDEVSVWVLVMAVLVGGAACTRSVMEGGTVTSVEWTTTHPLSGEVSGGTVEIRAADHGGTFPLISIDRPAVG